MRNCPARKSLYWLLVVMALIGVGCGREPEPVARPEMAATIVVSRVTPTPTELATAIPSATATVTAEPYPAGYQTAIAINSRTPSATATFVPTPTPIPSPTLSLPTAESPPGLVYSTSDGLWLVDDSGNIQRLFANPDAELAPDGKSVLFIEENDIWFTNLARGENRQLTQTPADWKCCVQWWPERPDVILFGIRPEGIIQEFSGARGFLAVLDLASGDYQLLDAESELSGPIAGSPDGQTIAYSGNGPELVHWQGESLLFDPDTFQAMSSLPQRYFFSPAWSPNGRELAWMVSLGPIEDKYYWGVSIFDLESQVVRFLHLYQPRGTDIDPPSPVWSPDGKWLALPDGQWEFNDEGWPLDDPVPLWVIAADGTGEEYALYTNAASQHPSHWHVAWMLDGRWLAFTPEGNEESAVWLAEVGTWQVYRVPLPGDEGVSVRDWLAVTP